jgi:translation elongation factor EF-1alpha
MHAEFLVSNCYFISGVGTMISGEVITGEIMEGVWGMTSRGKKMAVSKIEVKGERKNSAIEKEKANIYVKHINRADISPGEVIRFD